MKRGTVSLVGAGPWDPELFTLKGKDRLESAEVVLYDDLVNPELLRWAPPSARKIYVGKRGGEKSTSQERIHRLLLRFSEGGKRIVRLKGGDPFLFGRGSQEALFLARKRIPFEVVPGVSSALACPAYAGIPVSDRDVASSVGIFTGTERLGKAASHLAWEKFTTGVETLIFLMGVRNFPDIVKRLLRHGRPPGTPCALIQWGTRSTQKTVTGTLKDIVRAAKGIGPPALFVVGDVVRFRKALNWFESKPLFGKRVLVTRPEEQAESFAGMLSERGAEVLVLPTSRLVPVGKKAAWQKRLAALKTYQWAFFNSPNGVALFVSRLEALGVSLDRFKHLRIGAIGPKTRRALEERGFSVSFTPEVFTQEGVVSGIRKKGIVLRGKKVLLFHAKGARTVLADSLKKMGASVTVWPLYVSRRTDTPPQPVLHALKRHEVDFVTFTSASCVDHFFSFFPRVRPGRILNGARVASIGPVTSRRCRDYGLRVAIEAKRHTGEGLLDSLCRLKK